MKSLLRDTAAILQTIKLVRHTRRCVVALFDGTIHASKREPAFWASSLRNHSKGWRYPIITPTVREYCSHLGIKIDSKIERLSDIHQLCTFLSALDEPIKLIMNRAHGNAVTVTVSTELDPQNYVNGRAWKLPGIFGPIRASKPPEVALFLHGSMADLQYTAFSDVDDLVVVRRAAWEDPERLLQTAALLAQIARKYQDIDPYQHHGHIVLTEFDLLAYDQSILPLVALRDAVRVCGEQKLQFTVRDDHSGFVRNARNTIRSMEKTILQAENRSGLNAFALKGLVGEIAILPAYIFQAHGEMMSKPDAIANAPALYSRNALPALEWATIVRNEFDPLVNNCRVHLLRHIARLTCPRRHQAERLFRRYSPWIRNDHRLGLRRAILLAIQIFLKESRVQLESIQRLCT